MGFTVTTHLGEQGQVTLPAEFVSANGLEPGDALVVVQAGHQLIIIPEKNRNTSAKNPREVLLEQAGAFSDDESLDELRASIYAQRGRDETEQRNS